MAYKCIKCGYTKEECGNMVCPRCNSSMMFEGCGSCTKCRPSSSKKEKKK
ncbi:MAG: hypothetical protein QF655_03365 [Candidatus Woesearchaeota archaeon]|jgi:hypothetical protein|nr:hypothetical protein [Candidatus Woesearchaeota archaeon]MDP6265468.1 hypothetical protein [Candidatus Woesearchaeota archaeon]MDP7322667.1 hypothetical protein [Candidatus Woesearchaeota archaeon]MDP7476640.1 hypothetical protein [Candidatus Woesearchaeota archaeon]|tara:strand:+ start:175 stop:324 length:150 start_codon:yes stop_codon:yes gene_type:complete